MDGPAPMTFISGQHVTWVYHPQMRRRHTQLVAAEVVYASYLRVRIRVRTAQGTPLLRWVDAKNLRAKAPNEPDYPYPEAS